MLSRCSAEIRVPLTAVPKQTLTHHDKHANHPLVEGTQVSVTNHDDLQYYASFLFGSQQTAMTVILDPGSSRCWVPSNECTGTYTVEGVSKLQCPNKNANDATAAPRLYDMTASSTVQNLGTTDSTSYVSGTVSGKLVKDHICVAANTCSDNNVEFLAVTATTGDIPVIKSDGICGLSFISSNPNANLVRNLF